MKLFEVTYKPALFSSRMYHRTRGLEIWKEDLRERLWHLWMSGYYDNVDDFIEEVQYNPPNTIDDLLNMIPDKEEIQELYREQFYDVFETMVEELKDDLKATENEESDW